MHVALADVDHRPPLGEAGAEPAIFDEPFAQAVEALGDDFVGTEGQGLGALVDLDAGNGAGLLDQLDQRRAVVGVLPDRLVEENDAGNVFRHLGAAEQHFAIVAPRRRRRLDADGVEALLDGAGGFVGGQDAAAGRDHRRGDLVQFGEVHRGSPRCRVIRGTLFGHIMTHPPAAARVGEVLSASTPGSALPSSHSRKAPPAVET